MAESTITSGRLYYGVCDTPADTQDKEVIIQNPSLTEGVLDLKIGDELVVLFKNGNDHSAPQLTIGINDQGQDTISTNTIPTSMGIALDPGYYYEWPKEQLVGFIFHETEVVNGSTVNYWRPILIEKASDTTYGVTKLITKENFLEGNEDQPVSQKLIRDMISGGITLSSLSWFDDRDKNIPGTDRKLASNERGAVILEKPTGFDYAIIPKTMTTGELSNTGDGTSGAKYWVNNKNNYFVGGEQQIKENAQGIGYEYITTDDQEPSADINNGVRTIIPWYKENNKLVTEIGFDPLKLFQSGNPTDKSGTLIANNPETRIYGEILRNGFGTDNDGKLQIGTMDAPNNDFRALYTFDGNKATFTNPLYLPVDGLYINNEDIDSYIKQTLGINPPMFTRVSINIGPYTYEKGKAYPASFTDADGKKQTKYSHISRRIKESEFPGGKYSNGYAPIGIVGVNINAQKDGTGDGPWPMIWECYLGRSKEDQNKGINKNDVILFAFHNMANRTITINCTVHVLFCKKEYTWLNDNY